MIEFLRIHCIFSLSCALKCVHLPDADWWQHLCETNRALKLPENMKRADGKYLSTNIFRDLISLADNELLLLLHLLPCLLQLQLDGGHQLLLCLHHHLAQFLLLLFNLGRETLSGLQGGKAHLALHKQFSLLCKLLPKDSASTKATFPLQLKNINPYHSHAFSKSAQLKTLFHT